MKRRTEMKTRNYFAVAAALMVFCFTLSGCYEIDLGLDSSSGSCCGGGYGGLDYDYNYDLKAEITIDSVNAITSKGATFFLTFSCTYDSLNGAQPGILVLDSAEISCSRYDSTVNEHNWSWEAAIEHKAIRFTHLLVMIDLSKQKKYSFSVTVDKLYPNTPYLFYAGEYFHRLNHNEVEIAKCFGCQDFFNTKP